MRERHIGRGIPLSNTVVLATFAVIAAQLVLANVIDDAWESRLAVYRVAIIGAGVALVWCIWSVIRSPKRGGCDSRWRYALIGTGLGCASMATAMVGMYEMARGQTTSQIESGVQISGLFTYLAWSVGLFALPAKRMMANRQLPWVLDVALIVVSLSATGWFFLVAPQARIQGSQVNFWMTYAFPVINLLSTASVVAAMTLGGPFRSARGLLMIAIIGNVAGDALHAISVLNGLQIPAKFLHIGWTASAMMAGLAALVAHREIEATPFPAQAPEAVRRYGVTRAVVPAVFVAALVGLALWANWARPNTIDVVGLNLGCLVAVVCALARLLGLVQENADLVRSLEEVNGDLDDQVRARTRELSMANADVERQKAFLRSVVDSLPSFVVAHAQDGRIAFANQAAARAFGRTVEEMESLTTHVLGAAARGGGDREVLTADGIRRVFEVVRTPVPGVEGGLDQLLVVGNDITVRKEAERTLTAARDAAEEAIRVKREFMANMSHELRTPLNGVLGFADLLLAEELPAKHREYAASIRTSGESLLGIINDVLDLAKLESGQVIIDSTATTLAAVLSEVVQGYRPQAAAKGLDLRCEVHLDPAQRFATDARRIRQILGHLLSNAIKFTEAGTVWVDVDPLEVAGEVTTVRISVRDTGIGIPDSQREKVFEAFTQVDNSLTRRYGGAGLGLSLCRQFVGLLGGTLTVETEEGNGSRFMVDLPLRTASEQREAPSVYGLEGLRVLLVEDNAVNQMITERLLVRAGCTVDVVENGEEALGWLAGHPCDVVLMDVQMPVMDGLEATRRIREMGPPIRNVAIVAVTANAMEGDRERCLQAGMTEYVPKPILPETLLRVIARSSRVRSAA